MKPIRLPIYSPNKGFPPVDQALGADSPACGLLAMGGDLSVPSLLAAYRNAIYPWFSQGQPILWWSPDPRMVLEVSRFKLHRSFKQHLQKFRRDPACEIRFDSAFEQVILACANSPRGSRSTEKAAAEAVGKMNNTAGNPPTSGTWIVPDMVQAYCALHRAGHAHSVETWVNGELAGGLYCVTIGKAVFGESMFSIAPNASKTALAALVAFSRALGIERIDCQQNTAHLASLGAAEVSRADFLRHIAASQQLDAQPKHPPHASPGSVLAATTWRFEPIYWNELF